MSGDLHSHTTFSDGSTKIDILPDLAKVHGLKYLAVTDHDTVKAINWCKENQKNHDVTLIPALEISCIDPKNDRRVHILCYNPVVTDELVTFCDELAQRRDKACCECIRLASKYFPALTEKAVRKYSEDAGSIYKQHIMRHLLDCGYTDRMFGDLYKKLFGDDTGTCLVQPRHITVWEGLELAKNTKGVIVFAHPSVYDSMELVRELVEKGLIDGVEIEHPRNTEKDKKELYELAEKHDLIITGGTDFHGSHGGRPQPLATCTTEDEMVLKILKLSQQRQQ